MKTKPVVLSIGLINKCKNPIAAVAFPVLSYGYLASVVMIVLSIVYMTGCNAKNNLSSGEKDLLVQLRNEIVFDLRENLIPFWMENSVDHNDRHNGFYGAIESDGTGIENASKHIVLFTRYLWTWSAAYRVLGEPDHLDLAHRAYDYINNNFTDRQYGGLFMELNSDGTVSDSSKMTYGLSFAIYGFSEYYRITQNRESLEKAIEIYNLLENHALDSQYGGYLEMFSADWRHLEGEGVVARGLAKSMNTHLHLLEAYTNLYRVWPDEGLKKQLHEIINIFLDHILNKETHHLELYFEKDWTVYGRFDSYGHDIEFSWLLIEAANVLGNDKLIDKTQEIAVSVARVQLDEGMNSEGAMIYEKTGEEYRKNISWWVQAEAVVGFLNAWEISGHRKFLDASFGVWKYIEENMIDRRYGGWFPDLNEDGEPFPGRLKGNAWTCPYHNVRMGLEVYERAHDLY